MFKKLTKNVSITIHKDRVYLHLKKCRPVIISAEDKFRKGIEFRRCSECRCFKDVAMVCNNRYYCTECTEEYFKKRAPINTEE